MPETKNNLVVRKQIESTFRGQARRVLSQQDVFDLIKEHHEHWRLDKSFNEEQIKSMFEANDVWEIGTATPRAILLGLVRHGVLKRTQLPFPHRGYTRFSIGEYSIFELLQSLDQNAYFTHYTAVQLHGLTEQIPKAIYLNVEQFATGGAGQLSQESIDRAFKGKPRITNNVIEYDGRRVFKLNGMNTNKLGVTTMTVDESSVPIAVTNIERTLIDITVRPMYAGGVSEVAKAYAAAAEHCSVNKIAAYLRKLNFTYPYHQAIGYYLERSDAYAADQVELLARLPMEFDFYLSYQMKNTDYSKRWRLYIPKGF
jgi:predicted transcriptional regulator of viral defense system